MSISLILDADIDTDCDDAGALALLHTLADCGEVNLLSVICDIPNPLAAQAVMAINAYFGRPNTPVGLWSSESLQTSPRYAKYRAVLETVQSTGWRRYNETLAANFTRTTTKQPMDAIELYRKTLASQPDRSVVIVAIGLLTALQGLLESGPDRFSPLFGHELVSAKVKQLVTMGIGSFPVGKDVFNWEMDRESTGVVLNHWPAPLVVSEWGETVLTGAALKERTNPTNPIRIAYEIHLGGPGRNRSSWDQLASLYGVRGARDYFQEKHGFRIHYNSTTGEHAWHPARPGDPEQIYLGRAASDETLARTIEALMTFKR